MAEGSGAGAAWEGEAGRPLRARFTAVWDPSAPRSRASAPPSRLNPPLGHTPPSLRPHSVPPLLLGDKTEAFQKELLLGKRENKTNANAQKGKYRDVRSRLPSGGAGWAACALRSFPASVWFVFGPRGEDKCLAPCPALARESKGLLLGYWVILPIREENNCLVGRRGAPTLLGSPLPAIR